MGTWMQKTAVSWVIYSLTHSKFMLGVSVFATLFPSSLFSLLGGVVADRYNRYRVLLLTQILSMVQAILLTLVVFFKNYAVWEIIALSVILGIINGFDVPARQSLVYELVDDKKDLPNAVALNSSMVNLSKLIGPALAGIAIEKLGAVVCFGLNALSFIAVISSLLLMRLPEYIQKPHKRKVAGELYDGLMYIKRTPSLRFIVLIVTLISLFVLPFSTLMPVYAKDIFHGNAATFGILDSMVGLGAFIGAIFLASLKDGVNLNKVLAINTFIFGIGLILFSYTSIYLLALFFITLSAFGMMAQNTVSNTLMQTTADPAFRGRVISVYVMLLTGMTPVGSLLITGLSEHIGVKNAVLAEGIAALFIGLLHVRYLKNNAVKKSFALPLPSAEQMLSTN